VFEPMPGRFTRTRREYPRAARGSTLDIAPARRQEIESMSDIDAAALLDLDRYPVLALAGPAGRRLVEICRAQIVASGYCELEGFARADAIARIVRETEPLVPLGHHAAGAVQPYLEPADPTLPEGHPRRHLGRSAVRAIAYDRFPATHPLRVLYEWDPLMDFVAAALGEPRLHRYADPLGALNVAAMGDGDELDWHFDQTDFVVSIALRDADEGGDFEVAPNVRSADDERYADVGAVLRGDRAGVRRVGMVPGTLLLFKGRYSLHRVTPIRGATPRLVALLAYDTKPGTVSSELLRYARYGRSA
jgi:hypothetical protein